MSSSTGHRSGKLAAAKSEKDLLQDVLGMLLRDEDNKYCADCDAKSPRWASWNIGVFLCIRCAGIHRKLGVHISRVKSVNLDSWTAEQVAGVAAIGNSLARAAYEANVPDGFRRPQTDATLEQFIKAKYEEKRYLARDWVLPKPDPAAVYDLLKTNTAQRRAAAAANSAAADGVSPKLPAPAPAPARRSAGNTTAAVKPPPQAASQSKPEKPPPQQPQQPAPPSAVPQQPPPDLLGGLADDGFGDFSSGGGGGGGVVSSHANDLAFLSEGSATTATAADLFASDSSNSANTAAAPKKSMKDSIMALYGQQNTAAAAAASSGGGGFLAHNQQQQHFGGMQYSMSTPQLASVANSTGYQPMPQQQQHSNNIHFCSSNINLNSSSSSSSRLCTVKLLALSTQQVGSLVRRNLAACRHRLLSNSSSSSSTMDFSHQAMSIISLLICYKYRARWPD
ncbi:hypothetical protein BOX15_Mlig034296g2 [Macrostomum lignano]|uniref:Arf-GAP domain-containing protein n=1 Tax=Macrostomum lignano TaxID=282301 RepID=A0A267DZI1_9PLAT|nr:hypothetical protein BOX15_Mlig034296g2 [Macrostomum lignano]